MQGASFMFTVKSKLRKKFTAEEDDLIRELVARCDDPRYAPWPEIAAQVPDRTPRQVRERFQHYLSPRVAGGPWSRDEDDRLRRLHAQFGSNWAAIAALMPGRANTAVKNRWNTAIKDKDAPDPGDDPRQPDPEPDSPDRRAFDYEERAFDYEERAFDYDGPSWFDEVAVPPDDDPWGALQ
jgi:hypothetical protein